MLDENKECDLALSLLSLDVKLTIGCHVFLNLGVGSQGKSYDHG